ncbi:helix-turn-helix domain containing protein [Dehalobacterium formicoaceticum]|uniref:helix-turn-helix domain containing protein n=1 Tax=Dehalobacterium formicoaceticum TaxID=51515 RepID=UPI000B7E95D0|nr:helix-turn-helix domain containing protein [Dehalobacterium formicoaceticum]
MKEIEREKIAQQRYDLIAPIVKHPAENMGRGERYAILRSIAEGRYPNLLPEGKKVGLRTLERYLQLYEQGGFEALKPNMRGRSRKIPSEYLEAAAELKRENMQRSINTIITLLEQAGKVPNGVLKPSTVYDFLVRNGLPVPFFYLLKMANTLNLVPSSGEKSFREMFIIP